MPDKTDHSELDAVAGRQGCGTAERPAPTWAYALGGVARAATAWKATAATAGHQAGTRHLLHASRQGCSASASRDGGRNTSRARNRPRLVHQPHPQSNAEPSGSPGSVPGAWPALLSRPAEGHQVLVVFLRWRLAAGGG